MTIAEYAERVLYAETLEEKLKILPLAELTDDGIAAIPPQLVEPGRPMDLRMRIRGAEGKPELPSRPQLVDEESRGVLFHFFGNHELMAAELMALALLRFPDAPRAFRMGLLQTLREEQRHTLWYVRRMEECGVTFGTHPLNRFFWDMVAQMETPLDYVTRLSLTFEQANLDYARHFAGVMREAGDEKSGKLMDQIYRDEISHVGYGLKWFRKWKREGQSDWEAYQESLVFPLSASRAKGNGAEFNAEGRLAAGLDEEFVRELAVFERSKGRTPNVHWFNPHAEDVMARGLNGGDYEPKRSVTEFVRDLEGLALYLARRDDVVLVRETQRREYLERIRALGFDLPEFEKVESDTSLAVDSLTADRRLNDLRPWSWDPRVAKLLAPLRAKLPKSAETTKWSAEIRGLFSKISQMEEWPQWSDGEMPLSHPVIDGESWVNAAASIQENWGGPVSMVWKPEFAAAGRGFRRIEPEDTGNLTGLNAGPNRVEWCGRGVLEPWVDRVFDFSVQFEMTGDTLRRIGFTRQLIGERGRYLGTVWSPKFCRGLDSELAQFLMHHALPNYDEGEPFPENLRAWLAEAGYRGPVGIDAFVYRDRAGNLAHRVVCEVNPRFTMGRLACDLSRRVSAGHALAFSIEKKQERTPPEEGVRFDAHRKLTAGRIALTDVEAAGGWGGWLKVARDVAELAIQP
ncbi:MAG: DUF455 family protein [Verrucomicrobiae bacterium]|nr:DUF455 family protein [Verrucomicrobiae bacterium]